MAFFMNTCISHSSANHFFFLHVLIQRRVRQKRAFAGLSINTKEGNSSGQGSESKYKKGWKGKDKKWDNKPT